MAGYRTLDWSPRSDGHLKEGEVVLHKRLHEIRAQLPQSKEGILANKEKRIRALEKLIEHAGCRPRGRVLEIGAGDGWCSAVICSRFDIDEMYVMEIDEPAVNVLIPQTLKLFGVDLSKVTGVLGSFNKIPLVDHFDFVVSMGALHHSSNLFSSLSELTKCLKPGGWLLAQEPSMDDSTRNEFYARREDQEVTFHDEITIKNGSRSDVFYRRCEYLTAGYHAGLDIDCLPLDEPPRSRWFRKAPWVDLSKPQNIILIAQKPSASRSSLPVTAWEDES